ncbi:hypothetical protein DKZ27_09970 [Limosilactobacillus reuteri]|uniref:hypothetical protein n=1 Tax=Limosilactobacillus reuteri TaxID=1598 RepID=UPI000D6FBC85|nr:hypothetical protein [Limosilactobacillus reuteri]PWT29814.1 hypothetical protein DKZ27_09970 [Limosilactobacillus reuteri]
MIKTKLRTELVSLVETACGEAILTMKRGEEEKQLLIAECGLSDVVYDSAIDYYLDNEHWTQEQFDNYWENGGEDKEIDNYVDGTVDFYDDDLTWEELETL